MPWFEFEAQDARGLPQQGILEAADQNEAVQELSRRGLRVRRLESSVPARPGVAAVPAAPATQAAKAKGIGHPVATKPFDAAQCSFLLGQLGQLLQAGIAPAAAMSHLAQNTPRRDVAAACSDMAARVAEGTSLSDAMERYPLLFEPGAIGAARAGEQAGCLPAAILRASDQQMELHKLRRSFWWVAALIPNTISVIWVFFVARGVMDGGIEALRTGGDPGAMIGQSLMKHLASPWSILILACLAFSVFLLRWGKSPSGRPMRDSMTAKTPILKKKAMAESLAHFSWHLGNLSRAGLSPWTSWTLAARAVPNSFLARRIEQEGSAMRDASQLSVIARQSRLFPPDFTSILATGEMTGRVAESLDQAVQLSEDEARAAAKNYQFRMGCWGLIVLIGGGLLGFMVFYSSYLYGALRLVE